MTLSVSLRADHKTLNVESIVAQNQRDRMSSVHGCLQFSIGVEQR